MPQVRIGRTGRMWAAARRTGVWPLCGLMAVTAACGGGNDATPAPASASTPQAPVFSPIDPDTARALAAATTERYAGVLPCADCAGIRTELVLTKDPSTGRPDGYQLLETYLGSMSPEAERTITTIGVWTETTGVPGDDIAPVVRLDGGGRPEGARAFERLNLQELRLLDKQGARISSMANYSLMRQPDITLPAPPVAEGAGAVAASGAELPMAMVTDRATGWPVTLRVGQRLSARMASDPGLGGRWTLRAGSDAGVVRLEGAPASEGGGAEAVEVFTLTAVKPGQTSLAFDYVKKGDTAPVRSSTYPVTVQ